MPPDRRRQGVKAGLLRRDWADRYLWIVEAALKNRDKQFVIDGEAIILGAAEVPALPPHLLLLGKRFHSMLPVTFINRINLLCSNVGSFVNCCILYPRELHVFPVC